MLLLALVADARRDVQRHADLLVGAPARPGIRLDDPMIVDSALMTIQAFHIDFVMVRRRARHDDGVELADAGSARRAGARAAADQLARAGASAGLLALLKFFGLFIVAVSVPTAIAYNFVSIGAENISQFPRPHASVTSWPPPGRRLRVLPAAQHPARAGGVVRAARDSIHHAAAATGLARRHDRGAGSDVGRSSCSRCSIDGLAAGRAGAVEPGGLVRRRLPLGVWRRSRDLRRARRTCAALAAGIAHHCQRVDAVSARLRALPAQRDHERGPHAPAAVARWATLAARLLRPLLRTPLQRGLAAFMLATLGRSQTASLPDRHVRRHRVPAGVSDCRAACCRCRRPNACATRGSRSRSASCSGWCAACAWR